jgi:hypothetical protein
MAFTHAWHEVVHAGAAVLLTGGGAALLVRAVRDRLSPRRPWEDLDARLADESDLMALQRVETILAAGLSLGAAAIHLAAAHAHIESLGTLGLGFYVAAVIQAAVGLLLLLGHPRSERLLVAVIAVNLALVAVWAWSRMFGMPGVPGGPEPIGVADAVAVVFELCLAMLLIARIRGVDRSFAAGRHGGAIRSLATSSFVALSSIIVIATTVAVVDANAAHAHPADHHAMVHAAGQRNGPLVVLPMSDPM